MRSTRLSGKRREPRRPKGVVAGRHARLPHIYPNPERRYQQTPMLHACMTGAKYGFSVCPREDSPTR